MGAESFLDENDVEAIPPEIVPVATSAPRGHPRFGVTIIPAKPEAQLNTRQQRAPNSLLREVGTAHEAKNIRGFCQ